MNYNFFSYQLNIESLAIGIVLGLVAFFLYLQYKKMKRERRIGNASDARIQIMEAHKGLNRTNELFQDLYDYFSELEKKGY